MYQRCTLGRASPSFLPFSVGLRRSKRASVTVQREAGGWRRRRHRAQRQGLKFSRTTRVGRLHRLRNLQFGVPTWVVGTRKEVWSGRGREAKCRETKRRKERGFSLKEVANHLPSDPLAGETIPVVFTSTFRRKEKVTGNETRGD